MEVPIRVTDAEAVAREWLLALASMGVSGTVRRAAEGFVLSVPSGQAERAAAVLATYESENRQRVQRAAWSARADVRAGLSVSVALLAFFLVTGPRDPAVVWFERGSADAERILAGELWRAITALTLHADLNHVLSNAVAGALFVSVACGALGAGVGLALILVSGAGGNLVNALLHGSHHVSVGASTAVFAAVGVLGSTGFVRRRSAGLPGRRAWLPIAAAFALLAMLGMSQHTDVWAHFFGFAVGSIAALPVAKASRAPAAAPVQWALGGAALALLLGCWMASLGAPS